MAMIEAGCSLIGFEYNVLRIKVACDSGIDLERIEQLDTITIDTEKRI